MLWAVVPTQGRRAAEGGASGWRWEGSVGGVQKGTEPGFVLRSGPLVPVWLSLAPWKCQHWALEPGDA